MSVECMRAMPRVFWRFHWAAPGDFTKPGLYYCHRGNRRILPLPRPTEPIRLVWFPEVTDVVAKDQPEYLPLPAHIHKNHPQGKLTFCWKLSLRVRLKVLVTGKLWHQVLTFDRALQPQLLTVEKPEMRRGDV